MPHVPGISDHIGVKILIHRVEKITQEERYVEVKDNKNARKQTMNLLIKLLGDGGVEDTI